jgi:nardilysin
MSSSEAFPRFAIVGDIDATKSHLDSKEYRLLRLSNGMRVLLISDGEFGVLPSGSGDVAAAPSSEREKPSPNTEESRIGAGLVSSTGDSGGGGSTRGSDSDSEPHTDESHYRKAAIAMAVGVGSFSDPPHLQGAAHFLEHMLFMGR